MAGRHRSDDLLDFGDTEKAYQLISFVTSAAGPKLRPLVRLVVAGIRAALAHTFPSIQQLSASNENESDK